MMVVVVTAVMVPATVPVSLLLLVVFVLDSHGSWSTVRRSGVVILIPRSSSNANSSSAAILEPSRSDHDAMRYST